METKYHMKIVGHIPTGLLISHYWRTTLKFRDSFEDRAKTSSVMVNLGWMGVVEFDLILL